MSREILLLLPWYHHKIHKGVSEYAAKHNWHVNAEWTRFTAYLEDWQGDGIITQAGGGPRIVEYNARQTVPMVNISQYNLGKHIPNIFDPDEHIATVAVDYLVGRGFSNFAYFNRSETGSRRNRAFEKELKKRGFNCHRLETSNLHRLYERKELLAKLISKLPKMTAVFCPTDDIAAELVSAALSIDIKIPEDIAVLGVHNDDLVCESTAVKLSSIDCGLEKMGYKAAEILDSMISGNPPPKEPFLIKEAKVITRESTDILAFSNKKMLKVMNFLRTDFKHDISIEDIAKAGGLSVPGLQYLMKRHLNTTAGKELERQRHNFAKQLLKSTDWTIEYIGIEAGFKNERNFFRIFKKHENMTPNQYRKQSKQ